MVTISFDNKDMNEAFLSDRPNFSVQVGGNPDLKELTHLFRTFLYGLTYNETTIREHFGEYPD